MVVMMMMMDELWLWNGDSEVREMFPFFFG